LGVRGSARASIMESALYAIASPCVTWVNQLKRLRLGSCSFHHRVALQFLRNKFQPEILTGPT